MSDTKVNPRKTFAIISHPDAGKTTLTEKLLLFGDSITQGYDSADPARSYASRLTDALCAEGINKGIGGERFYPALATLRDDFLPDYITVAYGTNDWSSSAPEVFQTDCRAFYENLRALYPDVKIFAMRPLWRPDGDRTTACGSFITWDELTAAG